MGNRAGEVSIGTRCVPSASGGADGWTFNHNHIHHLHLSLPRQLFSFAHWLARQRYHSSEAVAMDFTLRCNSLKCRASLTDRALVTTCRSALLGLTKPCTLHRRSVLLTSHPQATSFAWTVPSLSGSPPLTGLRYARPVRLSSQTKTMLPSRV